MSRERDIKEALYRLKRPPGWRECWFAFDMALMWFYGNSTYIRTSDINDVYATDKEIKRVEKLLESRANEELESIGYNRENNYIEVNTGYHECNDNKIKIVLVIARRKVNDLTDHIYTTEIEVREE